MGGQIIDATIIAAPKQRNTEEEKRVIKAGGIPADWAAKPAKLRQKDRDVRWTVKYSKAKPSNAATPRFDLAVPAFGYKNHIGIDREHRLIRTWCATDAARHDGALLAALTSKANTATFVKGSKNDGADAEAIFEASTRIPCHRHQQNHLAAGGVHRYRRGWRARSSRGP